MLSMDPAGVGALIGVSIMVGGVAICLIYEKYQAWKKNRIQAIDIPVNVRNPLLKKQSSVKKLFVQNG